MAEIPFQPRAILFDFDGLIADTEPIHFEGFRQVVRPLGIELIEDIYYTRYVGYDDRDGFAAILRDFKRDDLRVADLLPRKADLVASLMRLELQAQPGVVDFVLSQHESGQFEIGICSGALKSEVRLGVEALGIAHCFSHIVAADDVEKSKPDPEGYLMLAQQLSGHAVTKGKSAFTPQECIVLEDTATGLKSARAAGCYAIGITGTDSAEVLARHADLVLDNIGQLDFPTVSTP